jgi:hypothetical protein
LRALGISDTAIDHGAKTGRLRPVFPAAYAVGHMGEGLHSRMLAAVLACGEGAVLSHGAAAALLGLRDHVPAVISVIAPRQSGRKIPGIRRHYVPYPARDEAFLSHAIPCTTPSRTIVDLAGMLGERSLRRTLDRAAFLRVLDVPTIDAVLARHRRRRRSPGGGRLYAFPGILRRPPFGRPLHLNPRKNRGRISNERPAPPPLPLPLRFIPT